MSQKKAKRQKSRPRSGHSVAYHPAASRKPGRLWPAAFTTLAIAGVLIGGGLLYAYWYDSVTTTPTDQKNTAPAPQSKPSTSTANSEVPKRPNEKAPPGMVWIPGGTFWRGSDEDIFPDARPAHRVQLGGFWLDETPVTNSEFGEFVRATGYKTVAERQPNPQDFPGAPPELLTPGSIVFSPPDHKVSLDEHLQWWKYVPGADWRHPEGPQSDLKGRENHPVVHVCWDDAMAYARWADKRLPTEAEFEYAARGGLDRQPYAWGNELTPNGKWQANVWQGVFPVENSEEDGYTRTSPVKAFPANGYGLYDMAGNVWQWCSDWYRPDYFEELASANKVSHNPLGPSNSFDPQEPGLAKRVQRGGSFLCSSEYCVRYRVAGRGKGEVTSGSSNVGFRCARSQ